MCNVHSAHDASVRLANSVIVCQQPAHWRMHARAYIFNESRAVCYLVFVFFSFYGSALSVRVSDLCVTSTCYIVIVLRFCAFSVAIFLRENNRKTAYKHFSQMNENLLFLLHCFTFSVLRLRSF